MKSRHARIGALPLVLVATLVLPRLGWAQAGPVIIEPRADALLKQMSQTLAALKEFSFQNSSLTDEVTPTGQKIQYSKRSTVSIRRPDAIRAVVKGDRENLLVVYDGKTCTLFDPTRKEYARAAMPPTIDAALDTLATKYGIIAPLADFLFSNPYESFTGRIEAGVYLGEHDVNGTACHHLAFRQPAADWQIWIETGQRPLPRKLVITYKLLPGEPQFIANLDNWNLEPKFAAETFAFTAPAGAKEVELTPIPSPATQPAR
jgi:hypothetical protein